MTRIHVARCISAAVGLGALVLTAGQAAAQGFNAGIPAGWSCLGNCGTAGPNGDVTAPPTGSAQYGYVSTVQGVPGQALPGVGGSGSPTNGSTLRSTPFAANSGDVLTFYFDYVTSDGSGFADYAWARLLGTATPSEVLLFTARTTPSGNTVPGFAMPAPAATLTPSFVTVTPGATNWSALGSSSGSCFNGPSQGCGSTGWVLSTYNIGSTGGYLLEFGVTNWNDQQFDSGMAFDGLALNAIPIEDLPGQVVPEPASMTLLATGLVGMAAAYRRRRRDAA